MCVCLCVCVWLECSTGKVTIVSRNSHESGGQVSGLWLENGYDVSLDWPCKIWILDFSRALYEVPLSKAWPAHCWIINSIKMHWPASRWNANSETDAEKCAAEKEHMCPSLTCCIHSVLLVHTDHILKTAVYLGESADIMKATVNTPHSPSVQGYYPFPICPIHFSFCSRAVFVHLWRQRWALFCSDYVVTWSFLFPGCMCQVDHRCWHMYSLSLLV